MEKEKETIKVCPECGNPLKWTFCFDYNEYYCLNCGYMNGMLGAGDDVELTPVLKMKAQLIDVIWKRLYGKGGMLPEGEFKIKNCKKCGNGQYHNEHLTKKEEEINEEAWKILENIKGIFNPKTL
jgi:Zn ribbon nucleic-acid-binding protein